MQFIFAFSFALISLSSGQDCVWDKDTEYPLDYEPLLVDLTTWISIKPVMEGSARVVRITEDSEIVVACPGELLVEFGVESVEATCTGGLLDVGGTTYDIMDFECDARIDNTALADLGNCSSGAGTYSSIGFDIDGYDFLEHIKVCFEGDTDDISFYASHIVWADHVEASDGNPSRPSFKKGSGFYDGYHPNSCYSTSSQDSYFTTLTGDPDFIDRYSNEYFSRGHMAPNGDFFIEMEADATFFYINAMPQWMKYNGQNWLYAERAVRDLAESNGNDLTVYTGPYGQQSLMDTNGDMEDLYLCASQGDDLIPIPEYVWKVVYENATDLGIAIVQSNVPYLTSAPTNICTDQNCTAIDWISQSLWYPTDLTKGYTICCTVQDWKTVNPHAPDLPTAGFLGSIN